MNQQLASLRVELGFPEGKTGPPPFSLQTMLRVHFIQQLFTLSDPAMGEAFFNMPLYSEFVQLEEFVRLPDGAWKETSIRKFPRAIPPFEKYQRATPFGYELFRPSLTL